MPTYHPVMELADQKQLQELLQTDQHLARDQQHRTTQILQLDPQEQQQQPPSSMPQQLLVALTEEGADLTELTASNWVQQHSQHSIPSAQLQLDSSGVLFAAGGGGPVSVSYAVSSASTDGGSSSSKHLGFFSHYRRKQHKQDDSSPGTAVPAGEQDASTAAPPPPPSREEEHDNASPTAAAAAARPRTAGPVCRSSSSDTEEAEQQRVSAADTPARPKTANSSLSSAAAAAAGDQQQRQWLAFQQQQALGAAAAATAGVPATASSDARAAARIRQALAGRLFLENASHRILQASSNGGSGISRSGSSTPRIPAPLEPGWWQLQQQHSDYSPAGPEEGGYADAVLPRSSVAAAEAAVGAAGGAAGYYDQRAKSPAPLLARPGSPRPPSRSASPFGLSAEATAAAAAATASIQQAMAAANEEMQQLQLLQHLNKERRRLQGVARAAVARAAAAAAASVADTAAVSATGSHHGSLRSGNLNPSHHQAPVRWDSSLTGGSFLSAPTVGARGRQVSWESNTGSHTGNSSSSNSSGMHANGSSSIGSLGVGSLGVEGPPLMGYLGGAAVQQQQQQYDMLMQQQYKMLVQQQQLQHNGSASAAYDMRTGAALGHRPSPRVLPVSAQQQHANRSSETGAGSSSRAWDAAWLNAAGASNPAMQRCGSLSPKALRGVQKVAPSSPTAAGAAAGFGGPRPRHGRSLSDLPAGVLLQQT